MSCSSSPLPPAPALDLLDEYWFFSNTLVTNNSGAKKKKTPPPHLPRSPSTSAASGEKTAGPPSRLGGRRLLRTPSLPTSRVGMTMELPLPTNKDGAGAAASASAGANQQTQRRLQAAAVDEVDDDDLNWSSIYEGVLRTRMAEGGGRSALHRAPSMPVPSSATANGDGRRQTKSTPSMPRLLQHSHSTLGRHTPPTAAKQQAEQRTPGSHENENESGGQPRPWKKQSQQQQPRAVGRCSKKQTSVFQFQDKKWKSSSDLESIEVQGFRDLGFVFDKEELRESLADVLPGLKQKQQTPKTISQSTSPRRPYLSEAWQQVRRPGPALARVQSAAEMKDQLRMWAQAVACNVRQEC